MTVFLFDTEGVLDREQGNRNSAVSEMEHMDMVQTKKQLAKQRVPYREKWY